MTIFRFTVDGVAKTPMINKAGRFQQGMKLKEREAWLNVLTFEGINLHDEYKRGKLIDVDMDDKDSAFVDISMIKKVEIPKPESIDFMKPDPSFMKPKLMAEPEPPVSPFNYQEWCDVKKAKIADCLGLLKEANVPPEGWQAAMAQITSWIR